MPRVDFICRRDPFAAADFRSLRSAALARGFGAQGIQVRVLAPDPGATATESSAGPPGVSVVRIPATLSRRNPIRSCPAVNDPAVLAEVLAGRPGVVIVQSSWMAAGALLLGAAGLPVILDLAAVEEDRVRAADPTAIELHDLRVIERLATRECEGILAASVADRAVAVRRHAAHEGRTAVVPHPAVPAAPCRVTGGAVAWWGEEADAGDRRSLAALESSVIPLLKRLRPGTVVRLAGSAAARVRAVLGVEIRPAGEGLDAVLSGTAAAILPAAAGGAGQAMAVEALSRGVPVVGSKPALAGLDDLGGAGLAATDSDDQLARTVADLLDNHPRQAALGDSGLRAVSGRRPPSMLFTPALDLLERVTRAWINPEQKLDALDLLKGRWPDHPDSIAAFLARRRRLPW